MSRNFVKSATTSTSVANSRRELERLLDRYGCLRLSVQTDYEARKVIVAFVVRDRTQKDAPSIPVRLEVAVREVYDRLFGRPSQRRWVVATQTYESFTTPSMYNDQKLAQAERVAWRNLILWVDAALSAAACGLQSLDEAFLAHTLVRDADGTTKRLIDQMNDHAPGGDYRALLAPAGVAE